ncbi:MAG: Gfo/Idh/MocA family oxidoreductase [Acidimicrobiaceae bacterium]|nr:Gfo/Idh/MocA family oxidoreductase [Acidimicrobiaceae bacterium]
MTRPQSTRRIRVGVLGGAGDAAEGHIRGYMEDPRAEVVAIWDIDRVRAEERCRALSIPGAAESLDALLSRDDIEAVSVCTPDVLHAEHVVGALNSGKHVLCEKPLCTTRSDAARIVSAVRDSGRVFLGGHVYHFRPDYRAMVDAYRSGEIGEPWLVEGDYLSNLHSYYGPEGRTPWRSSPQSPQDILLGGGCHPMGLMRWALGVEVEEVFAYANHKAEPLLPANDTYVLIMRFEDGTIGKLIAGAGSRGKAPTGGHLTMYGTKGTLWGGKLYRYDDAGHRSTVERDFAAETASQLPRVRDTFQVHYWAEQAEHFLDCIEGKATAMTNEVDAARVIAALTAGVESVESGKPVRVDNEF